MHPLWRFFFFVWGFCGGGGTLHHMRTKKPPHTLFGGSVCGITSHPLWRFLSVWITSHPHTLFGCNQMQRTKEPKPTKRETHTTKKKPPHHLTPSLAVLCVWDHLTPSHLTTSHPHPHFTTHCTNGVQWVTRQCGGGAQSFTQATKLVAGLQLI